MFTLIKNGYVIDPLSNREGIYDLLIENERIHSVEQKIGMELLMEMGVDDNNLITIDASGKAVMPGFIDLHVHLREPGYEHKETIAAGSRAAAAGGFTTICPMPNTNPVTDNPKIIGYILDRDKTEAVVNVLPVGAITLEQNGKELVDVKAMKEAGAVALSEDGKSVMDSSLYAKAMQEAAQNHIPIFAHCEDKKLVGRGVLNAGRKAEELSLPGISNAVEDIIVARDIILAKETGAQLHICHCSTRDSVKMIAAAKAEGVTVTGEICPHHFTLSEEDIPDADANYKMNPPLRIKEDVEALKKALREDVIDVIATDHAPHSEEEKSKGFAEAPFGIVGLETAFALTITELVKTGYLSLRQMVEKLSVNPARILGINKGCIGVGYIADLVIADLKKEYTIDKNSFFSKGKNTPFHGRKVTGRVEYTLVAGKIVYDHRIGIGG